MISPEVAEFFKKEGYWAEHPNHPIAGWKYEVANDDTRLGYQQWIAAREDEGQEPCNADHSYEEP